MNASRVCAIAALLSIYLFNTNISYSTTWNVPFDAPTIQAGVDSAAVGDTVLVECGEYFEYDLTMKSGISLLSSSGEPECVVLDANYNGRLLTFENVDNTTSVEGFTFREGYDDAFGGAFLLSNASPSISHCIFVSNTSGFGGGSIALNDDSNPSFSFCLFTDNSALRGGAFHCVDSSPAIDNCSIVLCSAFEYGAGFWVNNSDPIIHNSIIAFSITGDAFSCFFESPGNPSLFCCDIYGNEGGDWSGSCIEYLQNINDNYSVDPLFCDINISDFTLRSASPCTHDNNPACGLVGAFNVGCEGAFITVAPDGSGYAATIQDAVDLAINGDTIQLLDGVFTGPGNRDIVISDKYISIVSISNDPNSSIIDCGGTPADPHNAFYISTSYPYDDHTNIYFSGLTITSAYATGTESVVRSYNSNITIDNCIITENTINAGVVYFKSDYNTTNNYLSLSNTTISHNTSPCGLYISSSDGDPPAELYNCDISYNSGTGVLATSDVGPHSVDMNSCSITHNGSNGFDQASGTLTDCTILSNSGAGIVFYGGSIHDSHIAHNAGIGVLVFSESNTTFDHSTITYNGLGGVYIGPAAYATLDHTTIRYNYYNSGMDIAVLIGGEPGQAILRCCDYDLDYIQGLGSIVIYDLNCDYISGSFTEYSPEILGHPGRGTGVSFIDYDSDGNLDIYLSNSYNQPNRIYTNEGNGIFSGSSYPPLGATGWSEGHAWGDYNNDGRLDLYLANWNTSNLLLFNEGNRAFSDITEPPLDYTGNTRSVSWVDFDLDGDLDIYLSNEDGPNQLFMHEPGIGFFNVGSAQINEPGPCSAAAWCDYDNDGDQDVYLSLIDLPNKLIRNDGNGNFVDATSPPLNDPGTGQGVAWGDYDNDGYMDLYLCNYGQDNILFRNEGNGTFSDNTTELLGNDYNGQSGTWGDYDNDGDLDLYLTNYIHPNTLFINEGNGVFSDNMYGVINSWSVSTGTCWGDFDKDGDIDLYLANWDDPNICMRNDQELRNHWLHLNLIGTLSNHSCIGAKVKLVAGGTTQIREIGSNNGFRSQNSHTVEFGLRNWAEPDSLIIIWPRALENGQYHTTILTGSEIIIDSTMEIIEPDDAIVSVDEDSDLPQVFALHQNYPNPFNPITTISFDLPMPSSTTIGIYDIQGRHVMDLLNSQLLVPGTYHLQWDGTDKFGTPVSSGQYFYRIDAGDFGMTKKMMLIK